MNTKIIDRFFEEHRKEFLQDLARLIAIDSTQGAPEPGMPFGRGPAQALEVALEIAAGYGLYTENWDNYLGIVQWWRYREKTGLLAHLDVVPADPEEWTETAPFSMKAEGDRVFGRGTADDKGPALAAIYALRAIKELGLDVRECPRVFLGCNEESGSAELNYYFQRTEPAEMTISPDASFPVINVEKGILVAKLQGEYKGKDVGQFPRIRQIKGGSVYNTVAEKCSVIIEGLNLEEAKELLKSVQAQTQAAFICEAGDDGNLEICSMGRAAHASLPETGNNANTAMLQLLRSLPLAPSKLTSDVRYLAELFPHGDHHGRAAGVYMADDVSGPITVCPSVLEYDLEGSRGHLALTMDVRLPICFKEQKLSPFLQKTECRGLVYSAQCVKPHYVEEDSDFIQKLLESYEAFSGEKGRCISMGGLTYCHGIKNGVAFGFADTSVDNRMHGKDEFAQISRLLMGGKIYTMAILKLCND